jgi:hypothetical protein
MWHTMSEETLANDNYRFLGTGGRSEENVTLGFVPAFRDQDNGAIYRSCFADGRPAPVHVLDGLPHALVVRGDAGKITGVKASLVAGFVLNGSFFTREEAASRVSDARLNGTVEKQ